MATTELSAAESPSDLADTPDPELVRLYLEGDTRGFDELFRRYNQRLHGLCLRLLGDHAAADDMVQETFIKVLRSLESVDANNNFSAWLQRVASNCCTDELRRRQRRRKREFVNDSDATEEVVERVPDAVAANQPEEAAEAMRMRRLIWEVSKKLPERQRTALAMRDLQGLSYASIARFMKISESAVEALIHRARQRFKQEFYVIEGPEEEAGTCVVVERLLSLGEENLQATQKSLVREHIATCIWCKETYDMGSSGRK